MIALGTELNLTPLVEAHTEDEVKAALDAGSPSSASTTAISRPSIPPWKPPTSSALIPDGTPVVSESGIFKKEDLKALADAKVQAALIGESLIKQKDVGTALRELLSF